MTTDELFGDFLAKEASHYQAHGLQVRSRWLPIPLPSRDGARPLSIRVAEIGPETAPAIVWVHGGGGFGAQFARVIGRIEASQPGAFRHVIVDRPGCGASEAFFYWDEHDLRAHAVAVLRGVLDALGIERAGFVANSMGGLWSLWTSLELPERMTGLVLAGVPALFLDTSAPFPMRLCSIPWIGRRLMRLDPGTRAQAAEVMKRLGHPDAHRIGDEFLDLTATAGRLPHWSESFVSLIHRVLRVGGSRISFTSEEWSRVQPPVHLVWGTRDPFGGLATARRAVRLRPETRLDEVPGAGHLPWLENADAVTAAFSSMFDSATSGHRSLRRTARGLEPATERNTRAM